MVKRLVETLSRDHDDAKKKKTVHSRFLNKCAMISSRLVCVMWLNYHTLMF